MAKRQELKRKLRASDRRRRRRVAATPSQPAPTPSQSRVDVAGLIAGTILDFVDASGTGVRDVVIVSAIRSYLNATAANSDHAQVLLDRFHALAQQNRVDEKSLRDGLRQMLELAKQHRDARGSQSFIRYLALLNGE